jgi:hypothetical protein
MIDNGRDDDSALDAALASWLSEALDPMQDAEEASWVRFAEETLPEKDAWVRFSAIMTRAQHGVHQAIDRGTRPALRRAAVRLA